MSDITLRIAADGTLLVSGLRQVQGDVKRFATETTASLDQTSAASNSLAANVTRLGQVTAGYLTIGFASQLLQSAAATEQTSIRLRNLTGDAERYASVQSYLSDLAGRYGQSLEALTGSYTRVLTLENARILSAAQSKQLFEGLADAQAYYGASTANVEQVMFGLSQALTSGTVRAEELNQVTEPLPGLLLELDKAAGLTEGGFRRMVNAGEVTSAFFRDTLIKALDSYQGAAERNADSLQGALNRIQNGITTLEQEIAGPAGAALSALIDNIELLAVPAVILLTRQVWTLTAGWYANLAAAGSFKLGLASLVGVSRGAAAGLTTMQVAARGATAAMAFLPGLPTVLLAAGAAMVYFAATAESVEDKTSALADETKRYRGELRAMTEQEVRESIRATGEKEIAERRHLAVLEKELEKRHEMLALTMKSGGERAEMATLTQIRQIEKLGDEITISKAKVGEFTTQITEAGGQLKKLTEEANASNSPLAALGEQFTKLRDKVKEQEETWGMSGAALLEHELRTLKTKDATNALIPEIEKHISALKRLEAAEQGKKDGKKFSDELDQLVNKLDPVSEATKHYANALDLLKKKFGENSSEYAKYKALLDKDMATRLDPAAGIVAGLRRENEQLSEQVLARRANSQEQYIALRVMQAENDAREKGIALGETQLKQIRDEAASIYARNQSLREMERADQGAQTSAGVFGNVQLPDVAQEALQGFDPVETMQLQHATQMQLMEEFYQQKQQLLAEDYQNGLLAEEEYQNQAMSLAEQFGGAYAQLKAQQAQELDNINAQAHAMEIMWARMTAQQKTAMTLGLLGNLTNALAGHSKRAFEMNKKVSIAQTVMSTYESATQAYKAMAGIPYVGPVLGAIAAAAAIAAGMANVQKIRSTTFGGGGSGAASTPSFNASSASSAISNELQNNRSPVPEAVSTVRNVGGGNTAATVEVHIGTINGGFGDQNNLQKVIHKTVEQAVEPVIVPALQNYTNQREGVLFSRNSRQALELTGP